MILEDGKIQAHETNVNIQFIAGENVTKESVIKAAIDYGNAHGLVIHKIEFRCCYPENATVKFIRSPSFLKYLEAPSYCPFCKSSNISGLHWDAESGQAWQEVVCSDCEKEWHDIYQLSHFEPKSQETVNKEPNCLFCGKKKTQDSGGFDTDDNQYVCQDCADNEEYESI